MRQSSWLKLRKQSRRWVKGEAGEEERILGYDGPGKDFRFYSKCSESAVKNHWSRGIICLIYIYKVAACWVEVGHTGDRKEAERCADRQW